MPDIRRGEILAPHQWFEQPTIVTMKGGLWEPKGWDEDEQPATPDEDEKIAEES